MEQRCGTCQWWVEVQAWHPDIQRKCTHPITEIARAIVDHLPDAVVDLGVQYMRVNQGRTCPTYAPKEQP